MVKHGTTFCKRGMCLPLVCFEQYLSLEQVVCEFLCAEASTSLFYDIKVVVLMCKRCRNLHVISLRQVLLCHSSP